MVLPQFCNFFKSAGGVQCNVNSDLVEILLKFTRNCKYKTMSVEYHIPKVLYG